MAVDGRVPLKKIRKLLSSLRNLSDLSKEDNISEILENGMVSGIFEIG